MKKLVSYKIRITLHWWWFWWFWRCL